MFINLDILDKPFYYFFVRIIVFFNVFIQLLTQLQIFGLQLLFRFPSRMRINPVLNAFDLIARCQVYEFLDVGTIVVLDPFMSALWKGI